VLGVGAGLAQIFFHAFAQALNPIHANHLAQGHGAVSLVSCPGVLVDHVVSFGVGGGWANGAVP